MNNLLRGRNLINILLLSLGFIVVFFIFVIALFIPAGKDYKKDHRVYIQKMYELDLTQASHDELLDNLKELQTKNRKAIVAYTNLFDPKRFSKQYGSYFQDLSLTSVEAEKKEDIFDIYEVKTTSKITSPVDFYKFLKDLSGNENVISVEFPINFSAANGLIETSFRMKVYHANFQKRSKNIESNVTIQEKGSQL